MDAFQALMEEHGIILKAIDILEQSTKKELPEDFYLRLLEIIRNFADKCHHGKEEIALFPLIKQKDPSQSQNVAILLQEHDMGRKMIAALSQAVAQNDTSGKIRNAQDYSELLTEHIHKENILFLSWFKMMSSTDKERLYAEFEEIEERVIGKGKHEEYSLNLEKLKLEIH